MDTRTGASMDSYTQDVLQSLQARSEVLRNGGSAGVLNVGVFLSDDYRDGYFINRIVEKLREKYKEQGELMFLCGYSPAYRDFVTIASRGDRSRFVRQVGPSTPATFNERTVDAILGYRLQVALFMTSDRIYHDAMHRAYAHVETSGSVDVYRLNEILRILQAPPDPKTGLKPEIQPEKPAKTWLQTVGRVLRTTQSLKGIKNASTDKEKYLSKIIVKQHERKIKSVHKHSLKFHEPEAYKKLKDAEDREKAKQLKRKRDDESRKFTGKGPLDRFVAPSTGLLPPPPVPTYTGKGKERDPNF